MSLLLGFVGTSSGSPPLALLAEALLQQLPQSLVLRPLPVIFLGSSLSRITVTGPSLTSAMSIIAPARHYASLLPISALL